MSSIDPLSPPKMAESRDLSLLSERISSIIDNLKQQVAANWCIYVKKRMEENKQNLDVSCKQLLELSQKRRIACEGISADLLMKRMYNPISIHNGSSTEVKNDVDLIQLSQVTRIPPYTTWMFLNKNQEMPEDQSVVGRRRIYYDQSGEEALICSDSEEEKVDEQEYKKEFNESEDYILRMTIKEAGSSDAVLDALAQCFSRKPYEIKERYEVLAKADNSAEDLGNPLLDKDLNAALDSFDTLFCRRCFVFDCRLHGCSQDLVYPAEKLLTRSSPDEENGPCGPHCYKVVSISVGSEEKPLSSDGSKAKFSKIKPLSPPRERRGTPSQSESATSSERNISERNENPVAERVLGFQLKRQKNSETSDSENGADMKLLSNVCNISQVPTPLQKPKSKRGRPRKISLVVDSQKTLELEVGEGTTDEVISGKKICRDEKLGTEGCGDESMCKVERKDGKQWKTIEKSLYQKGLEIFGRNSCLIARNLMNSMKTCSEVFQYMNCSENRLPSQPGVGENYMLEDNSNAGNNETMGIEVKKKSRHLRRRRRVRRLKYSSKSAGYHLSRKRMSDRKDKPRPQYNPCGCESICGKECPCNVNGTCCEKFCGCPKTCKNRFRGCHCAKSQCQSRQCPCFAADRECDADVCRNCWIKCGDGSLGVPSQKGDNYECMNMKILLGQRQRVLLGPSNVSGWGAFLKNSVAKNEYLGEYTGEVVSQQEADKRGKIYDREDQSFLFNLNDQLVVDAFRKGDKLKFANHSSEPNCSAKVLMVAGDHRVGIFSKEKIRAGEELFYDYCYAADCAPSWAKKPEEPGYKKEETGPSKGRARKLA